MALKNWIWHTLDGETGIELLRAHFKGHAYDPHWHDSTPGSIFLLKPGELHDGDAP